MALYEFTAVISFNHPLPELKQAYRLNHSFNPSDFKVDVHKNNIFIKGFSRKPSEKVLWENQNGFSLLVGEAYKTGEKNVFCDAQQTAQFIENPSNIANLKGNFLLIQLDENLNQLNLFSSKLSINALYYTFRNGILYLSTSLHEIQIQTGIQEIDNEHLTEQQLFYFPLGHSTMLKGVSRINAASVYRFNQNGLLSQERYWDFRKLYQLEKIQKNAMEIFSEKFFKITNALASDLKKVNVALTAGFDSRSIYACLANSGKDIQTYAFGLKGSKNVTIPENISKDLNIRFKPIWLNDEFVDRYYKWFELCTMASDGYLGERTNYPYSFSQLSDFSPISINGNWGSEAIRPIQNFEYIISKDFYQIAQAKNKQDAFSQIFDSFKKSSFIKEEILDAVKHPIWQKLEKWFQYTEGFSLPKQIHMYLYFENERKFFANEIQTTRRFITNRYPYYDDEIVELLFQCPFSGVNKESFKKDFFSIYQSQYVYYYLLKKFHPALMKYKTDHGYAPRSFGSPLGVYDISLGVAKKWYTNRFSKYREFNNHELANKFYIDQLPSYFVQNPLKPLVSDYFTQIFENKSWIDDPWRFDILASNLIWFKTINDGLRYQ